MTCGARLPTLLANHDARSKINFFRIYMLKVRAQLDQ